MKKIFTLFLSVGCMLGVYAQAPNIEWQKSLGGTARDEAYSIINTSDGGYAVAGYSYSADGDVTTNHGGSDYWILKLTSLGNIQWQKSFGGGDFDLAYSIIQTIDGGYAIAGVSCSNDGDVTENHGGSSGDYWIVKVDSNGTIQWQNTLGGTGADIARSIVQTIDGDYLIAGNSSSNDSDVTGNSGDQNIWVVKLNSSGNMLWQKCYGGYGSNKANSIFKTTDGGYVVAGTAQFNGGDASGNHNAGGFLINWEDYWLLKLDSTGILEWQKCLGGVANDYNPAVIQTSDGGYALSGISGSNDGDESGNHGGNDYWVVKLSNTGIIEWQKPLGGSNDESGAAIIQTTDSCYLVAGTSVSTDGDVDGNHGHSDDWIVKLNKSGAILWQKSFGGSEADYAQSIVQTNSGGYAIAGMSYSNDGDVTGHHGSNTSLDYWIVKLYPDTGTFNSVSPIETPASEILIYPNPATNQLTITSNGAEIEQIDIYNTTGSLVMAAFSIVNSQLSIVNLPTGVYIAEVTTKEGSVRKRWVKM